MTHENKGEPCSWMVPQKTSGLPAWTSFGASVEALQDGVVGSLKQPLLAQGGGVTGVHEDSPLARAAVDAAVADRVKQTLILQERRGRRRRRPSFSSIIGEVKASASTKLCCVG